MKLGSNALYLQYLEMLREIAKSPATKIVIPLELVTSFTALLKGFTREEAKG